MDGIMDMGLSDRDGSCGAPRIPTNRYPLYSTTKSGLLDANGNLDLEFEADRDYLFTELSVEAPDVTGCQVYRVSAKYCNTDYLVRSSHRNWAPCCNRKPFFLIGVRENKTLKFSVAGGTADAEVKITLAGFQGNGCCG